jgi:exonuclease SbcC
VKLHRLELTGFGPFRETQTVDFDAFDADGVFLISGRTGAGKSSILDGVSFALYGSVPRYDGGERRLRSDHSFLGDPTEVRLEFTVGDRRWRVTRAPEYDRPAKRGGGTTTEPQRAELEENVGGQWIGRAAKPREVALVLDEILGLNVQQFQQVILLAQNKFSRFLLATAAERQTLLRTLFGTRRFEHYKDELDARRREAQRAVDTSGEGARTLLEVAERLIAQHDLAGESAEAGASTDLAARRTAAEVALQRAGYRLEVATRERQDAEAAATNAQAAWAAATAQAERLAALVAAREELAEREAEAPRIALDRDRLDRARTAETLRAPLDAVTRAAAAREIADAAEREARTAWLALDGSGSDDLTQVIDALTSDIALWSAAEAQEHELEQKRAALVALEASVEELTSQLSELDAHQALIPAERERLEGVLAAARARAERLDDARARRDALTAQLGSAREAAELAPVSTQAEAAYLAANADAVAAASAVTTLLQQRLAGIAGELATHLVDGEACIVCGSTDHPDPAPASPDAVTDEDLAAAEQARDRASAAERVAADAAREAREAVARAVAAAAGRTPSELEESLAQAQADVRVAEAAAVEAAETERQRAELDELATAARAERERVAGRRAGEAEQLSALQATVVSLAAHVDAARGDHPTVAARIRDTVRRRDSARELQKAREAQAERERALREAVADRDERLAASGIASAEAAAEALLDRSARDTLDARIARHAQGLAAVRARLLDLELDTVDLVGVDLDAARAARVAAESTYADSIAAETTARETAARLRELLLRVDDAYAQVGTLAEEAAVITRLADSVAGRAPNTMKMDLETFVLAAELEEIVAAANLRLVDMSSGRYTLHHSDAKASHGRASGLGIDVLDAHTGQRRSPQSLSGGETFLASLALALGLAEVVTNRAGGLRLDTLFIDEGFGSLDPETLDLAMRTLDELRVGGRTVGVISHVEAMKEQIPAQLVVEATGEGPSVIRQEAAAPLVSG